MTVYHNILSKDWKTVVVSLEKTLKWLSSYLNGRDYSAAIGTHGVPQRSISGPLLFSLYMLPLCHIIQNNNLACHSYADDTQIYLALSSNDRSSIESWCKCIVHISKWMSQNFLKLNKEKNRNIYINIHIHIVEILILLTKKWIH